jgi:hypothetical protein
MCATAWWISPPIASAASSRTRPTAAHTRLRANACLLAVSCARTIEVDAIAEPAIAEPATAKSPDEEAGESGETEEGGEASEGGEGEEGEEGEESEGERPGSEGHTSRGRPRGNAGSVVLSSLHLTRRSVLGLRRLQPTVSQVEFSFHLSKPTKVRVSLSLAARPKHSHAHWAPLRESLSISSSSTTHRLWGTNALAPGRYKLTASPLHGRGSSIYLIVHS